MLVGFGQTICKANGRKCKECKIEELCPSSKKKLKEESDKESSEEWKDWEIHSEWVSKLKSKFEDISLSKLKRTSESSQSNIFLSKR